MSDLEALGRYEYPNLNDLLEDTQLNQNSVDIFGTPIEQSIQYPLIISDSDNNQLSNETIYKSDFEANSTNLDSCHPSSPKAIFNIFSAPPRKQKRKLVQCSQFQKALPDLNILDMKPNKIGPLTIEERMAKLKKYIIKKQHRNRPRKFYVCRQIAASTRLRLKGRFIKGSSVKDYKCFTNISNHKIPNKIKSRKRKNCTKVLGPVFEISKVCL